MYAGINDGYSPVGLSKIASSATKLPVCHNAEVRRFPSGLRACTDGKRRRHQGGISARGSVRAPILRVDRRSSAWSVPRPGVVRDLGDGRAHLDGDLTMREQLDVAPVTGCHGHDTVLVRDIDDDGFSRQHRPLIWAAT